MITSFIFNICHVPYTVTLQCVDADRAAAASKSTRTGYGLGFEVQLVGHLQQVVSSLVAIMSYKTRDSGSRYHDDYSRSSDRKRLEE